MKLFVCIISCNKNLAKLNSLRNTWIKDLKKHGIDYRFFIGNKTETKHNDVVCLDVDDSYEGLRVKSIESFKYCLQNFNFDYLLKVDDDTFVDIDELVKLKNISEYTGWLSSLEKHKQHLKLYTNYMKCRSLRKDLNHEYFKKIKNNFYYAVGAFYFIRKDLLEKIIEMSYSDLVFKTILQEDISIGYLANKLKIIPKDISSKFSWYQISNNTFFHPIHTLLFKDLHNIKNIENRKKLLKQKIMLNNFYRFNLNE